MTDATSYHGQPVLKRPTWTWEIPCYLFTGGLAGASAGLAYVSELRGQPLLARRAWASALIGVSVSPLLLISDLGRPLRFLNMLRMFKVTSPMSVGSWILVSAGGTTTVAAARAWLGVLPRLGAVAAPAAALLGLPLATYTGALLSATSVPVWHEARVALPFVFAAGGALSAGAAVTITTPLADARPARRLALGATVAELVVTEVMEHALGDHCAAYERGAAGRFRHAARGCLTAGAAVLAARGGRSQRAARAAGALLLAGAVCTRWSVYKAGFESVDDPAFVVGPQRRRVDRREDHGASRRTTTVSPDASLGTPALPSNSPLR